MSDQQQRLEFAVTRTALPLQSTVAPTLIFTFETEAHTAVPIIKLSTQLSLTLALELNTALVPEIQTQVASEIRVKESTKEPCTTIASDKKLVLDDSARKVASALGIK